MKKIIISLVTISALASQTYAGGKNVIAAVAPVAVIPTAIDPTPFYIGLGLLWAGMSRDCACTGGKVEETTYGGIIRAGYEYNQYIGIEVRALHSSIDKDIATTTHYGLFLKPSYPVSENINVYGLLGYGKTKLDCVVDRLSYDENGFSWGVGMEYDFSNRESDREEGTYDRAFDGQADQERGWGVWIDYQNLLNDSGISNFNSNVITVGITYDF